MDFKELKSFIYRRFPDSILVKCLENDSNYLVTIYPKNAKPFVTANGEKLYMVFNSDFLINKRSKKVTLLPNIIEKGDQYEKELLNMKSIYLDKNYA